MGCWCIDDDVGDGNAGDFVELVVGVSVRYLPFVSSPVSFFPHLFGLC